MCDLTQYVVKLYKQMSFLCITVWEQQSCVLPQTGLELHTQENTLNCAFYINNKLG